MNSRLKKLLAQAKRDLDAADTIIVRPSNANPAAFIVVDAIVTNMIYEHTYDKDRSYQVSITDCAVYDEDLFGEPDE
ncbi:MAG TPA: hypothetical protein VKP88_07625 [Candidatus Paceibacterota bacterium]|nr:hypothetical protein [Candidatus Paceibacterota bacterium]